MLGLDKGGSIVETRRIADLKMSSYFQDGEMDHQKSIFNEIRNRWRFPAAGPGYGRRWGSLSVKLDLNQRITPQHPDNFS